MHGLKTIHQLNREAAEAREICEKHGVALGDIPAPTGPLPEPVLVKHPQDAATVKCDGDILDCGPTPTGDVLTGLSCTCGSVHCQECEYDLPYPDESAK